MSHEVSIIVDVNNVDEFRRLMEFCHSNSIPFHFGEKYSIDSDNDLRWDDLVCDAVKNRTVETIICDDVVKTLERILERVEDGDEDMGVHKEYIEMLVGKYGSN